MTFGRRLRLFMLGLGLVTIVSFMIFGKSCTNTAWAPEARVKLRMKSTLTRATPAADAALRTMELELADLRAGMDSLEVDFGASRRTSDSLYYAIGGKLKGRSILLRVVALRDYTLDSTSTLLTIGPE